jgi:hypothetical protein
VAPIGDLTLDDTVRPRADRRAGDALGLVDRPAPSDPPRVDGFALDLGGPLGELVLPSQGANANGAPTAAADTRTSAPVFGGRIGFFPIAHAGIESEVVLALPGFRGRSGVTCVASARSQMPRACWTAAATVFASSRGGGFLAVLAREETSKRSIAGETHRGAAFTIEARTDLWVRVEASM